MDSSKQPDTKEEYKDLHIPIIDANMRLQVARYVEWLSTHAKRNTTASTTQERKDYIESASKTVLIGKSKINVFAPFRPKHSAFRTITLLQSVACGAIVLAWMIGLLFFRQMTLVATLAAITELYVGLILLNVGLSFGTFEHTSEEQIDDALIHLLQDADWPSYTILCPLYHEAQVVPQFVQAISSLSYPTGKLQILLLTEEDDVETRAAIRALSLPPHFKIITVPDGSPRTKPRACNYGLMQATGQYVVIYDAEDIPEPLQLKKAVLTFANHGPDLACVQAKLNFYNPYQNLLTRLFTAEYSLWFDLILPGLQRLGFSIPLGGTSNHFQTQTLRALGGWDAFNVTEDCDLGMRLARYNLHTVVINSMTYEEANSRWKNWIRQRSRWIKGYMQTYLVNMRHPFRYLYSGRLGEFLSLQLIVGGKTLVLFLNPILLLLFAIYIFFRPFVGDIYRVLFPKPLLYMSTLSLVFGNFFYFYIYLIACVRRKQYRLIKWMVFIPFYWLMMSIAAAMALFELITRPHYWQKTTHGLHLGTHLTAPDEAWQEHNWEVMDKATTRLQAIPATAWAEPDPFLPQQLSPLTLQTNETFRTESAVQPTMLLPTVMPPKTHSALKKPRLTAFGDGRPTMPMPAVEKSLANGKTEKTAPYLNGHNGPLQISPPSTPPLPSLGNHNTLQQELAIHSTLGPQKEYAHLQDNDLDIVHVKDHRSLTSSVTASLRAVVTLPMPAFSRSERAKLFSTQRTALAGIKKKRDPWLYVTLIIACIACIATCWYSFQQQNILLYSDAYAHLRVARSVLDGNGLSIVQLGGVWLPLPHLLMLPFIWNTSLWQTGLAGSIPSMFCYLIAALYLYQAARALTSDGRASCIGSLVFLLNPNILYLQTTPLSDLVCIATLTLASYYFLRWAQDDAPKHLILAAAGTFLATLARYEGWALFALLFVLILVIGLIRRQSRMHIEGNLITFGVFGGLGILLWLLWNAVIFGNPLYFLHASSSWQSYSSALLATHNLPTYHDLWQSLRYYTLDIFDTLGPIPSILATLSLIVFLVRRRPIPEILAALAFLVPFIFYILALYTGQAILFVPEAVSTHAPQHLLNARFSAVMIVPTALFLATLICSRRTNPLAVGAKHSRRGGVSRPYQPSNFGRLWGILAQSFAIIAILGSTTLLTSSGIITLQDGQFGASCEPYHPLTAYFAQHYDGGRILEDTNAFTFDEASAGINLKNIIGPTSGEVWSRALHNPATVVDWIILRPQQGTNTRDLTTSTPDLVAQYINIHSPAFLTQFTLVVQEPTGIELYHRNGLPPLPTRQLPANIVTEHKQCGTGGS